MPTQQTASVMTVGYEGRTAEEVVALLASTGVDVLVDVRLTPLSRKPGLSKRALAERLDDAGIGYIHQRALGNPKENRDGFRRGEHESRVRFAEHLDGPDGQQALAEVRELLGSGRRIALLCFEHDPATCHRHLVRDQLTRAMPSVTVHDL